MECRKQWTSEMVGLNQNISIMILNVNRLNPPHKDDQPIFKIRLSLKILIKEC